MDWKNDEILKTLIEKGKQSGSLTFDEVNQALPGRRRRTGSPSPTITEFLDQRWYQPDR